MTQKKGFIKLPFQHGMLIGNDQTISNIDIEMTVQGIDEVENGYPNIMSVVLNDKSGFKDREVFEHALTNAYDGKLDAEFKSCYWGEMAIRYHQKNRKFGILIGVVDSSLVLGYISLIENPIVLAIIGGVTGLAVLIHNQLKWSEIIKNTRKKNEDWGEIKHKYYSLYNSTKLKMISPQDYIDEYDRINELEINAEKNFTGLVTDKELEKSCFERVERSVL